LSKIDDFSDWLFKLLPYGIIAISLGGLILLLALGLNGTALLISYIAVGLIIGSVIYLLVHKGKERSFSVRPSLYKSFPIIFFTCLSSLIIIYRSNDVRSLLDYALITIMASAVLLQILLARGNINRYFVLGQIVILFLSVVWGMNLHYTYYFGRTDIFAHTQLVESILTSGSIGDIFGIYEPFAYWHINTASLIMITEMPIPAYTAMFIENGIVFSAVILIVYSMCMRLFHDVQLALLAALITAFFPAFLIYGASSIPRSAVLLLEMCLFFFMLRERDFRSTLMVLFFAMMIILYHPASIPFVIVILALLFFMFWYVKNDELRSSNVKNTFLIIIVATVSYWIFVAQDLFQVIQYDVLQLTSIEPKTGFESYFSVSELFNYIQYSLFFVLVALSLLFIVNRMGGSKTLGVFCLLGCYFSIVAFPGPLTLIEHLGVDINISRFEEYAFIFVVLTAAFGFIYTYRKAGSKIKVVLIALLLLTCFFSISNDFVSSDNPLVERSSYTYYFSDVDIAALFTAQNMSSGSVDADYVVYRYYYFSEWRNGTEMLQIDEGADRIVKSTADSLVFLREKEGSQRSLKVLITDDDTYDTSWSWSQLQYYDGQGTVQDLTNGMGRVYSSGQICIYY
jgi:hypothetical protein